jgi:cytochrome c5
MKRLIQMMLLLSALSLLAQTSNVVLPQDKGPDKIDVSAYPAPQQAAYKLFTTKCSKCHTIARPMNTMMKRDEWERYVKRMMHKPNSGISDSQGKQIFEFLAYDQIERKDKNPKAFFPALSDEQIEKLKKQ